MLSPHLLNPKGREQYVAGHAGKGTKWPAKQTLSAYTVDSFSQSIQQQVGVFGTIAEG